MPHIICSGHAWRSGHYLSPSVLPLLKAMHHIYACFHGITHTPKAFTYYWQLIFIGAKQITHKNQNTLRTSKSAMVPEDHLYLM
jgi:hypothetical protein